MSKYIRYQPVISRCADDQLEEDHWLKKFEQSLGKIAVQPKNVDSSMFDQINSIMNGKSKFPSVAAAVKDMQDRSGLTAYLNEINKVSEDDTSSNKKVAQSVQQNVDQDANTPEVIKKCPSIKNTFENYIRDTKGNLPVPSIISHVQSIHKSDVSDADDWEDEKLIRMVSKMNLQAKSSNYSNFQQDNNLGSRNNVNDSDVDPSNTDAFHALSPAKV